MSYGCNGRVLHVDLTSGSIQGEDVDEAFLRQYLGGRALVAHYLLECTRPGIDPLGAENALVIAPSVTTGANFSGQGRNGIGAKSPLTNGFGNAEVGGFFGSELKRAGFDAVVIVGRAQEPVYLWVQNGNAELRDARGLWGKKIGETEDLIREDVGGRARTCLIGPAGENQVRYACVANDVTHFAGRTGLGAVMGSKNLKGIAAKADRPLPVADPAGVKELAQFIAGNRDKMKNFWDVGTAGSMRYQDMFGGLPTFNFKDGCFAEVENLSGETIRDTILLRRDTCFGCVIGCKGVVEIKEGSFQVDPRYGGPEYETLAALGSNCGVSDLAVVAKANELVASLGLDSISCGVTISFAMECYERGFLTDADTDGIDLRFGNGEALLQTIELIAKRDGFGDLLAEGVARVAERLGPETKPFAMHVRGQEIPMHDPRLKHGHGLGLIVSPTGAEHQANIQDPVYSREGFFLQRLQAYEPSLKPINVHGFDQNKIEVFFHHMNWRHLLDSLCICHFMPFSLGQLVNAVNSVTGWDTNISELMEIGERTGTMARLYNVREGLDPRDEVLPQRLYEDLGVSKEGMSVPVDPDELQTAKLWYFARMGWDERGVPTKQKLQELGIESLAEALPR